VDAIIVKIRTDAHVVNRPVYIALGIDLEGAKHVLGLWMSKGDESAKYWSGVLSEIRNRGVHDVCIVCTVPTIDAALVALNTFEIEWGTRYPAIVDLWKRSWERFIGILVVSSGDPQNHLYDQCHRVDELPVTQGHKNQRPLPDR
jgi:transposase-like protein